VCSNIDIYLIDYEYFNNLNEDENAVGTGMGMGTERICTSSYLYPCPPIEKSRRFFIFIFSQCGDSPSHRWWVL